MSADDGLGSREVAHRLFATEFDDAALSYSESDEERAPNYVVTPGGARVNRAFAVGVLTEIESVNEETLRGRVVDPTGPFVTYAGQYQPDEMAFLERASSPAFVALAGKARTFEPDDGDRVYTSLRPESFSEVDADTRDRWVVSAAERTLDRVATFDAALADDRRGDELRAALADAGAPESLAAGIPKAIAHYGTDRAYLDALREVAVGALAVVAGEREEAPRLAVDPDDPASVDLGPLPAVDVDISAAEAGSAAATATDAEPSADSEAETTAVVDAEHEESTGADAGAGPETTADAATEPDVDSAVEPATEATDTGTTAEPDVVDAGADDVTETDDARSLESELDAVSESEPATGSESTATTGGAGDGLGDFDTDGADDGLGDFGGSEADDLGDGDPDADDAGSERGAYELSEAEREEAMEHGVEFSTGTEVDDPGAADIDTPDQPPADLDDLGGDDADEGAAADTDDVAATTEAADPEASGEATADVDLEAAAVEAMGSLSDDGGADREAVIDEVVADTGADREAVDDAIQDALMAGKCFEPEPGTLQAI